MEKSIVTMENSMNTMEKTMNTWVNQWTPWKNRVKPWEKIDEQCIWKILAPKFSKVQPKDKVVPFFKKWLYLVASKLSLEVVPFCKTQAKSGDLSATMFLSVFVFSLALTLGLGIYLKSTYAKKNKKTHMHPKMIDPVQNQGFHIIRTCQRIGPLFIFVPLWHLAIIAAFQWHLHLSDSQHLLLLIDCRNHQCWSDKCIFWGGDFRCAERL